MATSLGFKAAMILAGAAISAGAQARFLQVDPIGYDDQVNLYAYVDNDPINARDPTGKRIDLYGTPRERQALRTAIRQVAMTSKELLARYNSLRDSENIHSVRTTNRVDRVEANVAVPALGRRGTGTEVTVSLQSIEVDGVKATTATQIAHELFSHSLENDRGAPDTSKNANTGIPRHEERASGVENRFRQATGQEERKMYDLKKLPPESLFR